MIIFPNTVPILVVYQGLNAAMSYFARKLPGLFINGIMQCGWQTTNLYLVFIFSDSCPVASTRSNRAILNTLRIERNGESGSAVIGIKSHFFGTSRITMATFGVVACVEDEGDNSTCQISVSWPFINQSAFLLRLYQMFYAPRLSYHSNTEVVLFECLSLGWATTTGRLLGPKMGNSIACAVAANLSTLNSKKLNTMLPNMI